jgi:hypothetical protein
VERHPGRDPVRVPSPRTAPPQGEPRGGNGEDSDLRQYEAAGGGPRWYVIDDKSKILGLAEANVRPPP